MCFQVFLILLQLYLSPSSVKTSPSSMTRKGGLGLNEAENGSSSEVRMNIEAGINLMNVHANQMDPLRALYLLPSTTSVASIRHFLETVSKQMLSERREGQLFRNLLLSQHLQIQGQRIRMQQSHKIVIEDSDLCTHCQKRIGRRFVAAKLSTITFFFHSPSVNLTLPFLMYSFSHNLNFFTALSFGSQITNSFTTHARIVTTCLNSFILYIRGSMTPFVHSSLLCLISTVITLVKIIITIHFSSVLTFRQSRKIRYTKYYSPQAPVRFHFF